MAPQTTRKIETIDTAQKRGKKTRIKWLRVVCGVFSTYSFDLRGSSWYLVPLPPYCAPLTTVELCLCHDILAPPQSIARCNFILFLVARCCWKKKKQQQPDDLLQTPAEYFTHFFFYMVSATLNPRVKTSFSYLISHQIIFQKMGKRMPI